MTGLKDALTAWVKSMSGNASQIRGRIESEPEPGQKTTRKRQIIITAKVTRAAGGPVENYNLVDKEI